MPPILQKITVPYEYPVYFTVDVFEPGNPDLVEALTRKEPSRRHRMFVVVERAVAEAWPGLAATIARYADRHADRLELVAPPWIVEGGEAVKNDPAPLLALQTVLHALRLDRQSFVLSSAAARCSTPRGTPRPPPIAASGRCGFRPRCSPRPTRASA